MPAPVCTCNFGPYSVLLDDLPADYNPHKPSCPYGPHPAEERVCPWCGDPLDPDGSYDSAMEAHATECPVYLTEQTRPCDREFGPHDHDDAECARMLALMNGEGQDDGSWLADALNREAEEQTLGRPLFPNEY